MKNYFLKSSPNEKFRGERDSALSYLYIRLFIYKANKKTIGSPSSGARGIFALRNKKW